MSCSILFCFSISACHFDITFLPVFLSQYFQFYFHLRSLSSPHVFLYTFVHIFHHIHFHFRFILLVVFHLFTTSVILIPLSTFSISSFSFSFYYPQSFSFSVYNLNLSILFLPSTFTILNPVSVAPTLPTHTLPISTLLYLSVSSIVCCLGIYVF